MSNDGRNDGFRVLEEVVCEPGLECSAPQPTVTGHGVNGGVIVSAELVFRAPEPHSGEPVAELS